MKSRANVCQSNIAYKGAELMINLRPGVDFERGSDGCFLKYFDSIMATLVAISAALIKVSCDCAVTFTVATDAAGAVVEAGVYTS